MNNARPTSFRIWLLEQQDRKDDVGAFARFAKSRSSFPEEATDVRAELRRYNSSEETMNQCTQAIREYNDLFASNPY
jgi:uncharacterized protein YozE (UPF0346 family)